MSIIDNLWLGLSVAVTPYNILFCLIGCLIGTLIGVLPGLGPVATLAMLLPITFHLTPEAALIMLAGIYYGAQYGGSTTAILVNIPGESSSVVTCLDGHKMAQLGRAGAALAIAAISSFVAGTIATILIAYASPPLATLAIRFQAPEYFSLLLLGLVGAIILAHGSILRAIGMILLGMLFGMVGTDTSTAVLRFTFGLPELFDGMGFVPIAMGVFGISQIIRNLDGEEKHGSIAKIGSLLPNRQEVKESTMPALRGTLIGSLLGVLPGGGGVLASYASYAIEKKLSRNPGRFGHGAPAGVAGPEAANNAAAQTSFIPMLTLGLPSNAVMAVMIGALTIHGVIPGPRVITQQPELFWGLIASMWIGNLMLLVINLPLIGMWVSLLRVPYRVMFPAILLICAIGVFSISNATFDLYTTAFFVVLGYILYRLQFEPAPLALGFILGPLFEENLRRAMLMSRGDPSIFLQRPISLGLLIVTLSVILVIVLPSVRRKREETFEEEE
ncbi:tripartite tricarboxylate transporter permease [Neorhizobium tomejilense]|uniref:tripartite tricarboxylate transporter permease n=1 Tax=Neorhizobium tomejilense TaxID=2093828 RepID=UPI003ECDBB90